MPEYSTVHISRAGFGALSNQIPGNSYEEKEYGMFLHQRGGDVTVNVERGCGFCDSTGVTHVLCR